GRVRVERLVTAVAALRQPAPDVVELHRPDGADSGSPRGDRLDGRRGDRGRPLHAPLRAGHARPGDRTRRAPRSTGGSRWGEAGVGGASVAGSGVRARTTPGARGEPRRGSGAGSRAWPASGSRTRGAARSTSTTTTDRGSGPCPAGASTSGSGTRATAWRRRSS